MSWWKAFDSKLLLCKMYKKKHSTKCSVSGHWCICEWRRLCQMFPLLAVCLCGWCCENTFLWTKHANTQIILIPLLDSHYRGWEHCLRRESTDEHIAAESVLHACSWLPDLNFCTTENKEQLKHSRKEKCSTIASSTSHKTLDLQPGHFCRAAAGVFCSATGFVWQRFVSVYTAKTSKKGQGSEIIQRGRICLSSASYENIMWWSQHLWEQKCCTQTSKTDGRDKGIKRNQGSCLMVIDLLYKHT